MLAKAKHGGAGRGLAWQARRAGAWLGADKARPGVAGEARQAGCGWAKLGRARQGSARQSRQDSFPTDTRTEIQSNG